MIEKTILVLPKGQHLIGDNLTSWEDRFNFITENLQNPFVPKPVVKMNNISIGHVVDYSQTDEGLFLKLQLNDNTKINGKYPHAEIGDYISATGEQFVNCILKLELSDEKQYIANEYKELNKELKVPNPAEFKSQEEWMQVCVPAVIKEGKDNDLAISECTAMWQNSKTGEIKQAPQEKKSKIDILSSIKKMVEKYGYSISDEKILEMFGVIEENKGYLNKLNKKLDTKKTVHDIQVFPKKEVYIEKYDEKILFNDLLFDQMIDAFNCPKLFKPYVDEDHQLKEKFAEIIDLYKKEDGFYAKIELNDKGIDAIKNNIYSYISPEWGDRTDTDGSIHKNVLWAITLTNIPALEGENPRLQDQIKLTKDFIGGYKMPKTRQELNNSLAKLEGKFSNFKLQDEPGMLPPEIMEAIQMLKDAIAIIDQLTQEKDQAVEESEAMAAQKEVAEKTATELQEKVDAVESEKLETEKANFFEKVVTDGQLQPDEVEDWKLQYDKSKDFVKKILTSRNVKTQTLATKTNLDNKSDEHIYNGKKYKLTTFDYKCMEQHKFDKTNQLDIERYIKEVGAEEVK